MKYALLIPGKRFVAILLLAMGVLLATHVAFQVCEYRFGRGHRVLRWLFDVDREDSLPTWFSAAILLVSSCLLYAIASAKKREKDRFARHWFVLSIGFLFLSVDEIAGVHETLNTVIDFPWTAPGAILVVCIGLAYLKYLIHLPGPTRFRFIVAGLVYVGGAVGVEHATGFYLDDHSMKTLGYNLLTPVEEGMEMLGVILFISALLTYMAPAGPGKAVVLALETDDGSSCEVRATQPAPPSGTASGSPAGGMP